MKFRIALFQLIDHAQGLQIVLESTVVLHAGIQRILTGVAKRRMTEIMGQCDGLGEVFVQTQSAGDGAREVARSYGRLALSLDMRGRAYLLHVFWPRMRARIGFSAGLVAALSMGDLGVVVLFADPQLATLPLQMYRLMAAYQMDAAAGAGLLLLSLSLFLFWLFDAGGRRGAAA